jgi:hypothetical protein
MRFPDRSASTLPTPEAVQDPPAPEPSAQRNDGEASTSTQRRFFQFIHKVMPRIDVSIKNVVLKLELPYSVAFPRSPRRPSHADAGPRLVLAVSLGELHSYTPESLHDGWGELDGKADDDAERGLGPEGKRRASRGHSPSRFPTDPNVENWIKEGQRERKHTPSPSLLGRPADPQVYTFVLYRRSPSFRVASLPQCFVYRSCSPQHLSRHSL